jgi:hypothetical protein
MIGLRSLDDKPRATLIQRFDGSVLLLGPKGKKIQFEPGITLHEIHLKVSKLKWVVAVEHLHISSSPYLNSQLNPYPSIKLDLSSNNVRRNGGDVDN